MAIHPETWAMLRRWSTSRLEEDRRRITGEIERHGRYLDALDTVLAERSGAAEPANAEAPR